MNPKILTTSLVLLFSLTIYSQSYTVTVDSADYVDLVGSTSLNAGETWDDPEYEIPFGFEFQYFDTIVNNISISETGLGGLLTFGDLDSEVHPVFVAYGADVVDRGYASNVSESNISYLVDGQEGSRILKIEWNNVGFYSDLFENNVSSDFANFQAWFYEGSNDVEIRIGSFSIENPSLSLDGETGLFISLWNDVDFNSETFGEILVLDGDPISPILLDISDNYYYYSSLNGLTPEGTIYRFSRQTSSVQEQLTDDIISFYPNPVVDNISISVNEKDVNITKIRILNSSGQVVLKEKYSGPQIDVSSLVPGAYFLELNTDRGVIVKEMVKM